MKLGIVGLPNVGKSTLFNAITGAGAEAANYPFCTIDPNVGVVTVPDERLDKLSEMYSPEKVTHAIIEFVDIAGLVKGAANGEGLGNKFLSHIREVDAIVHVVRCFENADVIHVNSKIDPLDDIQTINTELILSDIEILERRIDRATKALKGDKSIQAELDFLNKLKAHLDSGLSSRSLERTEDEAKFLEDIPLLSEKPIIYAANIGENDIPNIERLEEVNPHYKAVSDFAKSENSGVLPICANIEAEIAELDEDEKAMFLEDLGLSTSGLDRLIRESYTLLGLISFLTAGQPEVRAWTIKNGTKAPQAAGKIHSDIERGFIRAEIISFDDLISCGSMTAAKEKGLVRSEGKDYIMKDGDITLFRFNV